MALPTSYTEEELAGYMASPAVLGTTADLLAWTWDGGDYNEIINRVLEIANVDDVAEICDDHRSTKTQTGPARPSSGPHLSVGYSLERTTPCRLGM